MLKGTLESKEIISSDFTRGDLELIRQRGWLTYELTGASFSHLQKENPDFLKIWQPCSDWGKFSFHEVEKIVPPKKVSFNPSIVILPLTNNKGINEQMEELNRLTSSVQKWLPNSKFILGTVRDYLELDIIHFETKGTRLLKSNQRIRTATFTGALECIVNPNFGAWYSYDQLGEEGETGGSEDLWVMPLLVHQTK